MMAMKKHFMMEKGYHHIKEVRGLFLVEPFGRGLYFQSEDKHLGEGSQLWTRVRINIRIKGHIYGHLSAFPTITF